MKPVSTVASEVGTSSAPASVSISGSVRANNTASPVASAPSRSDTVKLMNGSTSRWIGWLRSAPTRMRGITTPLIETIARPSAIARGPLAPCIAR
jgi:hypothetical protein